MGERFDFIAINSNGVYAIREDDGSAASRLFVVRALQLGHRTERVPVKEACERHVAYCREFMPGFEAAFRAAGLKERGP